MVNSGTSRSKSGSVSCSPTPQGKLARSSDNTTLVNSPDDAGRLASAKATAHTTMGFSSSSLSQLQMPVKKNHASSIDMSPGAHRQIGFDDDDDNESSFESSLRSESQMSISAFSSNSDNHTRTVEQLNMKLEAVMASHRMLQFKAKARLTSHGVESSQYKNYMQKIEEKKMEIISIKQRIEYKRSLAHAEHNPTMPSSMKNVGR